MAIVPTARLEPGRQKKQIHPGDGPDAGACVILRPRFQRAFRLLQSGKEATIRIAKALIACIATTGRSVAVGCDEQPGGLLPADEPEQDRGPVMPKGEEGGDRERPEQPASPEESDGGN